MQVGLHVTGVNDLFGGDVGLLFDMARQADAAGLDFLSIGEHLGVDPAGFADYPFGAYPLALDAWFLEPVAALSAFAAITARIRLTSSVLIAPLRAPLLLAKSLATLDVLSRGRLDAGLAVGWHRQEYDAAGVDFSQRRAMLVEQIALCRAVWGAAGPARFAGRFGRFENLHVAPRPVQGAALPLWLGIAPAPRNAALVAAVADGWIAPPCTLAVLQQSVAALRAACAAAGRDPDTLRVRAFLPPVWDGGELDWAATRAQVAGLRAAGATALAAAVRGFCTRAGDIPRLVEALAAVRNSPSD